jgi:F0F1-type ATP synthase membrane subunit b/b'
MHRDPRPRLLAAALASLLFAAGTASASEGGIVLWPDWFSMLPFMIALFAALILPLNALLFRPLLRALDLRSERTVGTRERAEKLAASADEILARYEKSVSDVRIEAEQARRSELASARSETAARTASARADAEREIERARNEVSAALAAARNQLRAEAEPLAREAASRVLGRTVS